MSEQEQVETIATCKTECEAEGVFAEEIERLMQTCRQDWFALEIRVFDERGPGRVLHRIDYKRDSAGAWVLM